MEREKVERKKTNDEEEGLRCRTLPHTPVLTGAPVEKGFGGQNGFSAGACPGPRLPFQTLLGSPSTGRTQRQLKHRAEAHAAQRTGDVKLTRHLKARWALFLYRPPTKHRIQSAADAGAASCTGFSPP